MAPGSVCCKKKLKLTRNGLYRLEIARRAAPVKNDADRAVERGVMRGSPLDRVSLAGGDRLVCAWLEDAVEVRIRVGAVSDGAPR